MTVSATPLALRRMRANAQFRPWTPTPLRGYSFVGWSFALNAPAELERRFQMSLVMKKYGCVEGSTPLSPLVALSVQSRT